MTSKRIYQSIDFTLHHIMASGFSLILLIGAFLGEVFLTKTIWFYLLMYILSVCGLALLITVLWEGFACYTFTEDSITFRNIIRKETILKSEVLFTEPIEVLLIAGDSISHGSAIRIYDHKVKIQIETKNQTDIVYMKDIIFVEARERKVFVYTQKTIYESVQKIQFWAEKLPQSCFFQTHRSYIVNLRFVSRYDNSLVNLCNNKYRAYLTRRKYNSFKNAYITYLESMR